MFYKNRTESTEIKMFRSLDGRMQLSPKEKSYFINQVKGYDGEVLFDQQWLTHLPNCTILNDLLLEINNNTFQIDSMIVSDKTNYFFEVKNFEGDFIINDKKWFTVSGTEIQNPLIQLTRSETLLRKLLLELGITTPLVGYVILVNPEFHLYNAPHIPSLIFPNQQSRFLANLSKQLTSPSKKVEKIANQLKAMHITDTRFTKVPSYQFEQLKKGILCGGCGRLIRKSQSGKIVCICGAIENSTPAILRSIDEYRLLFPERKITTKDIFEWTGGAVSRKVIWRILKQNFAITGHGKSAHYIIKE
ncbi:MAG TPA: nuclease-related domain-containing protein [Bacillaceae bacterium]|nr:nuclease-related domain-containing protein [Paenibacillus bovis]HLU20967.1 nuclease-related domain-containing protein [Bacillaceae bacterium]